VTYEGIVSAIGVRRLEWFSEGPLLDEPDQDHIPPVCQWRFEQPSSVVEAAIRDAVLSFSGNVQWDMWRLGRNWVIAPTRLREAHELLKGTQLHRLATHIAAGDPSFGRIANTDVPSLRDHIRAHLEGLKLTQQ
jgi:hypothetical protein